MNRSRTQTRRNVLKGAAAAAAASFAAPYVLTSTALGAPGRAAASDRIVMATIGMGGRNTYDTGVMMADPRVQTVAVCDVQKAKRDAGVGFVNRRYGNSDCKAYIDLREMLARPDIDAVNIGTGENWHGPASILAMRAGKDVYCEKPGSHTIAEGRLLADTAKKTGAVYQGGTQRRSLGQFTFALHLARSGKLGRIKRVLGEAHVNVPGYIRLPAEPEPPREIVDWDIFLGLNPWRPFNQQWLRGWRGDYDFQGGGIKEWGSHTADLCQLAADGDLTAPVEYRREGKDFVCRYANGIEMVFTTGLGQVGVKFEGTDGMVWTNDDGVQATEPRSLMKERNFARGYPANDHIGNFLDCVKSRQQPRSFAEAIHRSMTACHCADISLILGRPLKFDPVKEEFIDAEDANRYRSRPGRQPWVL